MSYIIEVLLPNNESKQYQFTERHTVDLIKKEIFKQTEELSDYKREDFELGISEEERLHIEFYKLLSYKENFKEYAEQGLPIMLGLYKKKAPLSPLKFQKSTSSPLSNTFITSPLSKSQNLAFSSPVNNNNNNCSINSSMIDHSIPVISDFEKQKIQQSLSSSIDLLRMRGNTSLGVAAQSSSSSRLSSELKSKDTDNLLSSSQSSPTPQTPSSPSSRSRASSSQRFKALFSKSNKSSSDLDQFFPSKRETTKAKSETNLQIDDQNSKEKESELVSSSSADISALLMSRDDWALSEESTMVEQNQFGFHVQLGLKSLKPEHFTRDLFILEIPKQENLYQKYFIGQDHKNYGGEVEGIGAVFISMLKDKQKGHTRALIRVPQTTHHLCIVHQGNAKTDLKSILAKQNQKIPVKSLKLIKSTDLNNELQKFDNSHIVKTFKFGVLYCKEGQTTEEEWFGNEHGSDEFYNFLDILGERITLSGWKKFRGGLDVNGNSTGNESYYTTYSDYEIMFHVSTLLPYFEADEQKIERKRHLGNDIVVVIFKEGNTLFPPSICKSVFNHIYIVISLFDDDHYRVEMTIKDGVKPFGPPFPFPGIIHKELLRDFLLVAMINAEWAAYKSLEFSHKFKRTRGLQLDNLLKNFEGK